MKKHFLSLPLLAVLALFACGGDPSSENGSETNSQGASGQIVELIADPKFEHGINVTAADRSFKDGTIPENRWTLDSRLSYNGNDNDRYAWTMRQAGDIYGLGDVYNPTTDAKPVEENGTFIFTDPSKSAQINPTAGTFRYELNASKEYEEPRKSMEGWCHFLLEEGLNETIQISEIDELTLSVDATLDKLENHMTEEEYNPDLHTCQFLIYFICNSAASLDAGEYLWFGVPIFDYRYKVMEEYGNVDAGTAGNTGKFIYSMSTESYLPNGIEVGVKNSICVDMKEAIGHGLVLARQNGKLQNTNINDLSIGYMNMGYEIPGTFDSAMTIGNLSLKAKMK